MPTNVTVVKEIVIQQSPMKLGFGFNLRTQYHKTDSWNCIRSVTLLQMHEENILPYTVKIDSACAVTTFLWNFRFFAIRKSLKMPEWNFSSIHGRCMSKMYTNS